MADFVMTISDDEDGPALARLDDEDSDVETFRTSVDEKILRKKRESNAVVDLDGELPTRLDERTNGHHDGELRMSHGFSDEDQDENSSALRDTGAKNISVKEQDYEEEDEDVSRNLAYDQRGEERESQDEDEDGNEVQSTNEDSDSEPDDERDIVNDKRKREFFDEPPPAALGESSLSSFTQLNLSRPIMRAITALGWLKPTIVQSRTIPLALQGKDICGSAVTGSGKTAAFMVPILERLLYRPTQAPQTRVLVLVPTRELGAQVHSVATNLAKFCDVRVSLAVGGLSRSAQEAELRTRPDIVVATTGRLIDHVRNSAGVGLDGLEILVIDEADRILDEGFADELNEIIASTPRSRQTMLFSATMTDDVDSLVRLHMTKPVRLFIDASTSITTNLIQEFVRIRAHKDEDRAGVLAALCSRTYKSRCIIFFRSKKAAHRMKVVFGFLGLKSAELHGDLSQLQRLEALEEFRDEKVDFLMATDLAARGLDIAGIETVINYDMPKNYSQYVHRVGRTARGTTSGKAVSLVGEQDRSILKLALKNSRAGVKHRVIPSDVILKFKTTISSIDADVESVLKEEAEEKLMAQADMEATKAENLLKHKDEIYARPAKTWFQSEKEKKAASMDAGESADSKKGKREQVDIGKPKRSKLDGLSRTKRRRIKLREEDKSNLVQERAAAYRAKSSVKPKRIPTLAATDISNGRSPTRNNSRKPRKLLGAGFKKEISGVRIGGGGIKKGRVSGGKGVGSKGGPKTFKSKSKHKRR
ncbi:nucleolar DEAD-box protein required for synthesis of 60S ribosomal subunit [Gonapodya sp. JEL0774]|nr:nucleolar DEAD-box protein required for synthesis of 60S ribosomal subunit [Gonapodya sp. JEL0774]